MFCYHLENYLQSSDLISSPKRPSWFYSDVNVNIDSVFSCYIMSLMTLNIIVFRIVEFCQTYIFFPQFFCVAELRTRENPFSVNS